MSDIHTMCNIIHHKIKNHPKAVLVGNKRDLSLSVSRVLSCTVIYLGLPSPTSSSDIHGIPSDGQPSWRKPNLAAGGVYMAYRVTAISVSSYLAFPSLQRKSLRFISVALSLRSPSPDVIRHPVLCSSDFPHDALAPRDRITNSNQILLYHIYIKIALFFRCFFLKNGVKWS